MKQLFTGFALIAATLIFTSSLFAAVIEVPDDQPTIQEGIDAAEDGDVVLVADGTYSGENNKNISFDGKTITVMSENGPDNCIIDCEDSGRGFCFFNNETIDAILTGFTIRNGGNRSDGAGIFCYESSPTINDCVIEYCTGTFLGGGLFFQNSSAKLINCVISNNMLISDGNENAYGGGITCLSSPISIINCLVIDNEAKGSTQPPWITEGLIGGIYIANSITEPATIKNCTIVGNQAEYSNAVCCTAGTLITNCIVWDNLPGNVRINANVKFSDIQDGYPGEGNISEDPLFHTGPYGDYYLSQILSGQSEDSPCVDAGDDLSENTSYQVGPATYSLNLSTTRTDEIRDMYTIDMGYHYPYPSSFECSSESLQIHMPSDDFGPGDECFVDLYVCNPSSTAINDIPVFVILDVFGEYFFAPGFSGLDYYIVDLIPGMFIIEVIPRFFWPEDAGYAEGINWYTAMMNPEMTELYGNVGTFTFGWHE